jgi:RND family efflux transporter MFP subunit
MTMVRNHTKMETEDIKIKPIETQDPKAQVKPGETPGPGRTRNVAKWKFILPCAIIGVIGIILSMRQSSHGMTQVNAGMDDSVAVSVVKVVRDNLVRKETFEAEFRPYQAIDLHANVAGFVQSIKVDIGDQVRAGDLLATLKIPELNEDIDRAVAMEARNEKKVNEAAAAYEDAHLSSGRLLTVNEHRPHLIAKQDLDTAGAKDRAAEAALAAAKQDVEVSRVEVNKLRAILEDCKITAPFSGVITKRYADEGALIQGGVSPSGAAMPLVRLSQNDRLRLDFPVSVSYVHYIKVGDPVDIKIVATGQTMTGKISRFTRDVEMATRTMETEVDVPNSDLSLTPGIYAEVSLKMERRDGVLAIPEQALPNLKTPTAFVVNTEGKIEERPLTIGLATPDKFEVLSGLKENELVMVGGREQVKPGQKVEPKLMETNGL